MDSRAGGGGNDASLPPLVLINQRNIDSIEEQALQMVNRTLTALEEAIASYEGLPQKPADLRERYESYVKMHQDLGGWGRKFLLSRNEERTLKSRLELIRELCDICQVYAGMV